MPNEQQLIDALMQHQWYHLAALVSLVAVTLWRMLHNDSWSKIPTRWQWVPTFLITGLAAFAAREAEHLPLVAALIGSVYSAVFDGLLAVGAAHTTKRILPPSSSA
jgi:hypothetical protein